MSSRTSVKTLKNQQGMALLVLVITIVLAFAAYSLSGLSVNKVKTDNKKQTRMALKKAKDALLAYAISYPEITGSIRGPGYLPCPDLNNNGKTGANDCETGGVPNVGRLPWNTLGVDDLRDGTGERLWYAVSRNFDYSNSPTVNKINSATIGTITFKDNNNVVIYDGTSLDAVVAVVIAPGEALKRDNGVVQNRSAVTENDPVNYLDMVTSVEDNASFQHGTLDGFIEGEIKNGGGNVIVNDQFIVITYGEIMEVVHKRVSREISNVINTYLATCDAYPEASAFDPTKASYDSAGFAPPAELRQGHLPLDTAFPTNWGDMCGLNTAPVPPAWLKAENWDRVSYYAFAYQNAPPANGLSCGNGTNPPCMTVNNTNPLVNNAQALIVFAGRDITGNRPSIDMSDYFEGDNNDLDDVYDAGEAEDHVTVVTP